MGKTESFLKKHGDDLKKAIEMAYSANYKDIDEDQLRENKPFAHFESPWSYQNQPANTDTALSGVITISFWGAVCYVIRYQSTTTEGVSPYSSFLELPIQRQRDFSPRWQEDGTIHYRSTYREGSLEAFSEHKSVIITDNGKETGRFTIQYDGELKFADKMDVDLRDLSVKDGEKERGLLLSLPKADKNFRWPDVDIGAIATIDGFKRYIEQRLEIQRQCKRTTYVDAPFGTVPETMFWVLADGRLAGLALLRRYRGKDESEYDGNLSLYILPEYRNRGVGTEALQLLGNRIRGHGDYAVIALVGEENEPGKIICERHGRLSYDEDGVEKATPKDGFIRYAFPMFCGC